MPKATVDGIRKGGIATAILVVATAIPQSVSAQDGVLRTKELRQEEAEYIRSVRPYADCLVAHKATELPKLLGQSLDSDSLWIERKFAKTYPDCPRPKSSDPRRIRQLKGAIFEAMLTREFGEIPTPTNFDHVPQLVYYKDNKSDFTKKLNAAMMAPFDCIARRQPAKVRALLKTQPLSVGEGTAFSALREDFPGCFAKGERWEMTAFRTRPSLAEAFYTLMKMSQPRKASS